MDCDQLLRNQNSAFGRVCVYTNVERISRQRHLYNNRQSHNTSDNFPSFAVRPKTEEQQNTNKRKQTNAHSQVRHCYFFLSVHWTLTRRRLEGRKPQEHARTQPNHIPNHTPISQHGSAKKSVLSTSLEADASFDFTYLDFTYS